MDLLSQPAGDPIQIYRYRDGLYAPDLLTVGVVSLDLFSWLNDHPASKREICRHFELTDRPTDVMLTLFAALGLLENRNDVFHLTTIAREYLVKSSPWFLGPYYASLKDRPVCHDFLRVLRTGKPANWGSLKDEKAWAQAMEDDKFASQFTAAMDCRGIYLGCAMAQVIDCTPYSRFLDIAGGSGIYACSVVAAHPHMRATVFEKPPVDQIVSRLLAQRGYSDKVSVIAGDMMTESLPDGHDVHLFSNVLHDWDEPVVIELLRKSFAALRPGGMIVVHDAHINATKTGPLHVAEYSALLMHSTEGKCYSTSEMEDYLAKTGFSDFSFKPTAASRSIITAKKPQA